MSFTRLTSRRRLFVLSSVLGILASGSPTSAQTLHVPGGTVGNISGSNVGIGTSSPTAKFTVTGGSVYVADGSGSPYAFIQGASNGSYFGSADGRPTFLGNQEGWDTLTVDGGKVGIGTGSPAYILHAAGDIGVAGDAKFFARYNGSESYKGSFGWSHLQLGNNGPNWIVAGRTQAGASLTFVVNNTNDYAYNGYNGTNAMHITSGGYVGIGTTSPGEKFEIASGHLLLSNNHGLRFRDNTGATNAYFYYDYLGGPENRLILMNASSTGGLHVFTGGGSSGNERLTILPGGNVGIGTTSPSHKLAVNGTIRAKEVIVDTGWSDYVFAEDYRLAPLSEIEAHIKAEKHLPGIPSAAEVGAGGVSLGDMQARLLAKVEELTLHAIAQNKRLDEQSARIAALEQENRHLRTR